MVKANGGSRLLESQMHHGSTTFITKRKVFTIFIYAILPIAFLHFYISPALRRTGRETSGDGVEARRRCDYSDGRWVFDAGHDPPYNGTSCSTIKAGQNCMANGRTDSDYLRWRWKLNSCELSTFDAGEFLRRLRNKHLAFVGDSMARNQLESLLCLLSSGGGPAPLLVHRSGDDDKFRRWRFDDFNATVSVFWSPFLVRGLEKSAASGLDHNELHMDSPDEKWATEVVTMDVVVLSVGHWFLHPAVFYADGGILGCHQCPGLNHTEIGFFDVFRRAFVTALHAVNERRRRRREMLVVVTTFSPAHFEGEWDKAGACPRKEPYREGEKELEYMDKEMRKVQVEEIAAAATWSKSKRKKNVADGSSGEVRFEVLDVTWMAMMRPDGHPGPYMRPGAATELAGVAAEGRVQNDCVHWCLPGPIDSWNEILFQVIRE